ncbi:MULTISPECIES: type II toxin-antitoxin system RelE/ParE family toxin [Marinomonas]|uniref:Type II toxin-antitoxin system RelE/ParE family toxin n=1 Tax=Marinomonas rhodophyticola TaxID=2992803 RepID=A0ABT3KIH9_9GAMM|nr:MULTISPECIES: type II toxin-antitoxin system RelE/ParE family toxin [unclassified Marinomonas]MCW4629986.1 type II toxin-antitoxin system RelE/ParE family toxin [Marinomonas sp. KJ51-3]QUX91469.1 plasmid stabilization protein [Marinomonas sp. A3A]|tara:strand:- start:34060 stop:34371 length:312 start_codon:yes stop_codon:yes gene_type:complete
MAQIIWTEPALNNLNDIAEYIAVSNPYAARQLVENVFSKVQRLEQFPDSGRIPEEISTLNYREVVVNPCRVFYKVDNDSVYILHLLRQERDLRKYLLSTTDEN